MLGMYIYIFSVAAILINGQTVDNRWTGKDNEWNNFQDIMGAGKWTNLHELLNRLYRFDIPYQTSIVDPRTEARMALNNNDPSVPLQDIPSPFIEYPFQQTVVDQRTLRQSSNPSNIANEPGPIIKYPFRKSIVDPRTVDQQTKFIDIGNEPGPIIKYPFPGSIIDPRTLDQQTKITDIANEPGPIIKYPFPGSIIDPRTLDQPTKSITFADEPGPIIRYKYRKSIVDPRTTANIPTPLIRYPF